MITQEKIKNMERGPKQGFNKELQEELAAMYHKDQEIKRRGEKDEGTSKKHTERMKDILKKYGWPGKSLVDFHGFNAAWLLVQHSDHDVEFQKEALRLMEEAVKKGEALKVNLAYLTDRVRVNSGKPQLFGTQFHTNEKGELTPCPIEDTEHLDERRRKLELESFKEYEEKVKNYYQRPLRKQ